MPYALCPMLHPRQHLSFIGILVIDTQLSSLSIMKYLLLFGFLAVTTSVFGSPNPSDCLYEQLVGLNKYWISNSHVVIPSPGKAFHTEQELIQIHLQLVEQELRNRETKHLNDAQKQKRKAALDILHQYWQKGIFPQNLFHTSRTPYFIDHIGTACAVGQLIIETGNEEIANKISIENKDRKSVV